MISLQNLGARFGGKILFEGVSLKLDPGKRYGLTGANGSGKSTLLKILSGDETGYSGSFAIPKDITLGIMSQDQYKYEDYRSVDVVISGNSTLYDALKQKEKALGEPHNDNSNVLGEAEEIIEAHDGYAAEARACHLLHGLGIDHQFHYLKLKELSGGYRLRVLLARALFQNPDILLLDEPTNHLDILSIAWLEDYLAGQFKGMLIVISHDRHFLNRVATHILDVDYRTITLYTGNYDQFMEARLLASEQKLRENRSLEKKIDQLQSFVDRFKAKASKARQAQSRARQIEKIEIPEVVESSRLYPSFGFQQARPSGEIALKVEGVSLSYGDKQVLNQVSFELTRGQKIAVIGPNGIGKSTLIKIIAGVIEPQQGRVVWGYEASPAYFAQDHRELLFTEKKNEKTTAFEWLYSHARNLSVTQVRGVLGSVLLGENEVEKKMEYLSGGECARLILARLIIDKPNILLLDEPTNHLDLESINALEDSLAEFKGSVIFVSHDKNFIGNVADSILEIGPQGARLYQGSYYEYLDQLGHQALEISSDTKKDGGVEAAGQSTHQKTYQNKKELRKSIQKTEKMASQVEQDVTRMEAIIEELTKKFSDQALYQNGPEAAQKLEQKKLEAESELERKLEQWESLHSALETQKIELENLEKL